MCIRDRKFTNLGILKGSEFVIDPEKIGYETCAYIGIYLKDPESFDSVTKALEAIPEVVECHFTTGKYDMFIKIYAKNNHHLLSVIHDKLQPLGLARTETLISFHELSLIHISEPTRLGMISYAVFCLKKKKKRYNQQHIDATSQS